MNTATPKAAPARVVYREVTDGDLRKLEGQSNDTPSGGGARDIRFPWKAFRPVMHLIFNAPAVGRGGQPIRTASITYSEKGVQKSTTMEYWPPTRSRPTEDRVSKVHASPVLGGQTPDTSKGKIFVVFTQFTNGLVRCDYAYEDELRDPNLWAEEIRQAILGCLQTTSIKNATRVKNLSPAQGYYDFVSGMGFCYAD